MKMYFILNSSEVICDNNALSKMKSILCGRLAINHNLACYIQQLCYRIDLLCWVFSPAMAGQIMLKTVIYQMRRISTVLRLDESGSRRMGRHCFGCWCYLFITLGGSTIYIYIYILVPILDTRWQHRYYIPSSP